MPQHKDQIRLSEAVLPRITSAMVRSTPQDELDCTLLVRLLEQGPDPFYLMHTCPKLFAELCERLFLSVEAGKAAIEGAHWRGPGILLKGSTGLQPYNKGLKSVVTVTDEERLEALWILLASVSECTEEGYGPAVSLQDRLVRAARATINLQDMLSYKFEDKKIDPVEYAQYRLAEFMGRVKAEFDSDNYPHVRDDVGFYLYYKQGYKVVAFHAGDGKVFWGTDGSVTLDELAITVDKYVSPTYGIVFPKVSA